MNKTLTALIAAAGTSAADRIFDVQYLTWPLLIAVAVCGACILVGRKGVVA